MTEELDETTPSERLLGIADALTVRVAQLLAAHTRARLPPEAMDEVRLWANIAVRGAAIEGARNPSETMKALLPVPKVGRAYAQELAITTRDTRQKLPDGV